MTPVRFEPAAPLSQVKHSTTEPYSSCKHMFSIKVQNSVDPDQMASAEKGINRGLAAQGLKYLYQSWYDHKIRPVVKFFLLA